MWVYEWTVSGNLRNRFICGLRSQHVKQKLLSSNSTFQEAVSEAIAQEAARKDVKDIAASYGGETSASGDSRGVNEVTESHAVVFQGEEKVTQETKNQISPPETGSGASAVASRITNMITADTKAQSVSSVTKQAICSLNVLAGSAPLSQRKVDNMSVLQKISRN